MTGKGNYNDAFGIRGETEGAAMTKKIIKAHCCSRNPGGNKLGFVLDTGIVDQVGGCSMKDTKGVRLGHPLPCSGCNM